MRLCQLLGKNWKLKDLVEKNIKATHVKQTQLTTKDYGTKSVLPLLRQPAKHPASGRVGATEDMS